MAVGLDAGPFGATLGRVPLAGGAPREVLENVAWADWSPDGVDLAVVRSIDGADRLEFPIGKVLYESKGRITHARVSPRGDSSSDGKWALSILTSPSRLILLPTGAGQAKDLTRPGLTYLGGGWFPDSRRVAFAAEGPDATNVYAQDIDGGDPRAVGPEGMVSGIISLDGARAFWSRQGKIPTCVRARVQLPHVDLPITQRNAQLVIAREYGYAGWQDLTAEVSKRLGRGLEWAAAQARRVIHDTDVERLKQLLAEYPALLSWQGNDWDSRGGLLGIATGAYGDAGDPERERWFTRAACAELLIDAGAVVTPWVCDGLIDFCARGLLQLFQQKGLLPRTLKFLAALGDLDGVRASIDDRMICRMRRAWATSRG